MSKTNTEIKSLKPYLSKLAVWALSVGTSIGWGSLVVTNNEYLAKAGPIGSALGMVVGGAIMLVIARNVYYLINHFPSAGGPYTYIKMIFGYDRAFLISWFLSLIYMAMLWANGTSMPLFARYFFGDMFEFGYLYNLFGYDVYLGEVLLTTLVGLLFAFVVMRSRKLSEKAIIVTVLTFTIGISICFIGSLVGKPVHGFDPAFLPDVSAIRQVMKIAFITPWAFVGFESISHSVEEYAFETKKLMKVLYLSVFVTTLLYVFVLLLSVSAYPSAYGSWFEYISDLNNLKGIEGLPAFYAAYTYLGDFGVNILVVSLLGLIISSLIGNFTSLSRLFYALGNDGIIDKKYSLLNSDNIPEKAIILIIFMSLPVPFFGRTVISWIVDVTTIGAVLIYGFISAAVLRLARTNKDERVKITGMFGLIMMIIFGFYIMIQGVIGGDQGISRESQLLLILWSIIGLFYFRLVMVRDHGRRFGKNLTVWIVLVAMIFGLTMIWICEECAEISAINILDIRNHYYSGAPVSSISEDPSLLIYQQNLMKMIVFAGISVLAIFVITLAAMISNWLYIRKCEDETAKELGTVKTIAYQDSMTGVKSKHAYVEVESDYDQKIDQKKAEDFAVLVCDVNGLKYINDTLGHQAGDQYIKDASALICDYFKHSPVYRIGGDEFVVIINGHDYEDRYSLLEEFDRQIEENVKSGGVVVSTGISDYDPDSDNSYHSVFERADKLMYERKNKLKEMGAKTRD